MWWLMEIIESIKSQKYQNCRKLYPLELGQMLQLLLIFLYTKKQELVDLR